MASTYSNCVRRLSNFLRNQDFVSPSGDTQSAIANLYEAIMLEQGDFGSKGTIDFPAANREISDTIWHRRAARPTPLPELPTFSFDNAMSVLGMLSFAIPEIGMFAFAGVGAAQEILGNLGRQADLRVQLAQVSNPPPDPYKQIVDTLTATINTSEVTDDIDTMFGQIHAVQNVLNEYLRGPAQLLRTDVGAAQPALLRALKTRPGLTREHVLDERQGLGRIFAIEASDAWSKLAGADAQYRKKPMDHGLRTNPTYAQASLTAFLHACLTMVTAMQAYALLYPLPPKAFEPGWDGKNPDGSAYDPIAAIKATRGVPPPAGLPKNAWDALNTIFDRVNPAGRMSFTNRLREIDEIWGLIYARLNAVTLRTGLPANRDGMWYLESDKDLSRDVSVNDMNGEMDKWAVVSADACEGDQVALLDWNLASESAVDSYTRFHTVLNQEWASTIGHESDNSDFFRGFTTGFLTVFEGGGLLGYVEWLNEHYDRFEYPIKTDSTPVTGALSEVFWTARSTNDASLADARLPGFLSTQQGADTCAWLGLILDKYCAEYGFDLDLDNDTNTLDFARLVAKVFNGIYSSTGQFLGVQVRSVDRDTQTQLTFRNSTGRSVSTFWVDFDGSEKPYQVVPSGTSWITSTGIGHLWHVRDTASGQLLLTHVVEDEAVVELKANMVPISIVNKTGSPVNVFWVDDAGAEKPYGTCPSDTVFQNSALVGRIWVVRDAASGAVLKRITQVAPMTAYVP